MVVNKKVTSRIIHKRYLTTSKAWQDHTAQDPNSAALSPKHQGGQQEDDADGLHHQTLHDSGSVDVNFTPMSFNLLTSNVPLAKSRIFKTLYRAPSHAIPHSDLISHINLQPITTHNRRALNRLVKTLEEEGFLQRVVFVDNKTRLHSLQLTEDVLRQASEEEEEKAQCSKQAYGSQTIDLPWRPDEEDRLNRLLYTRPFTRQILDAILASADQGVTLRVRHYGTPYHQFSLSLLLVHRISSTPCAEQKSAS